MTRWVCERTTGERFDTPGGANFVYVPSRLSCGRHIYSVFKLDRLEREGDDEVVVYVESWSEDITRQVQEAAEANRRRTWEVFLRGLGLDR